MKYFKLYSLNWKERSKRLSFIPANSQEMLKTKKNIFQKKSLITDIFRDCADQVFALFLSWGSISENSNRFIWNAEIQNCWILGTVWCTFLLWYARNDMIKKSLYKKITLLYEKCITYAFFKQRIFSNMKHLDCYEI